MTTLHNGEDDSFIILGSSPGTSLDIKYSGMENGNVDIDKEQMEEAMKDLTAEGNMAFKAHFKLGDSSPSPASMMVASTIITDDRTTEELQKRFGELLDENVILKETLKQNNESMKEQFLLIASCQEDMMKTHVLHKEKFDETKGLVEKLRHENKKLKQDIARISDSESQSHTSTEASEKESTKSGPSSALEFVTSPDDDTINKLTAQLALVEKQRRQVIVENEKLTWQKESLEHIVDATSKERDDLKEKLKNAELQLSTKDAECSTEIANLKHTVQDLQNQIETTAMTSISPEELTKRDAVIRLKETRIAELQTDLKAAQLRILDLESVKLNFSKHKCDTSETVKMYNEQIQDLRNRLKEATTTVFQPVRFSISSEPESSSEYASFMSNVKLYDRTLKHLADVLNILTQGLSDSLAETLGLVASLHDYKLEKVSAEQFKSGLADAKQQMEKLHSNALNNIGQVRSSLNIFEGIFRDYNELLKKTVSKPKLERSSGNVEVLTAALMARGQELQLLEGQLNKMKEAQENTELMKAQLDLYKSDFEAERESREKLASERETILTDLRIAQKRNEKLAKQLEEVRKLSPGVYQTAASRTSSNTRSPTTSTTPIRTTTSPRSTTSTRSPTQSAATGNMVRKKKKLSTEEEELPAKETTPPPLRFDCPVCDKPFKSLIFLQQHVDNCLL